MACNVGRRIPGIFKTRQPAEGISFFDVKELYNLAYEQKAAALGALREYRRMETEARRMDEAYRAQLGLKRRTA